MNNNKAIFLLIRKLSIFSLPFFVLIFIYIILDPFKVIREYKTYYPSYVGLNRDYVSTTTFRKNYRNNNYNSFIFGNSRSIFYKTYDWKKYIGEDANCYHFDASGESLYGVYKKVLYLHSLNVRIKNALIILDRSTLSQTQPSSGHLFITSPQLEGNKTFFQFQTTFIKAFFSPRFIVAYFDFILTKKIKNYMLKQNLLDNRPMNYNVVSNEISFDFFEEQIKIDKAKYYNSNKMKQFNAIDSSESISRIVIKTKQKELLNKIKEVLVQDDTNYKVVISPLFDKKKLNQTDLLYLRDLLGEKNVYDFSGKNTITDSYLNYYETSHYRPHVARKIMNHIYKK